MKIYHLVFICSCLACAITKTEYQFSGIHFSAGLFSDANQTCPDDRTILQALQKASTTINELNNEIDTLNKVTIAVSVITLITLYLYIPLLYTTYKQVSAAEKRINQFAAGR